MTGLEHLARQRDELAELVSQLVGPSLELAPSVRLLADSLDERRAKLDEKLEQARRHAVRLHLVGVGEAPPLGTTATLLDALGGRVHELAAELLGDLPADVVSAAAALHLVGLEVEDGEVTLATASPATRTEQQLTAPDGRPLLQVVLETLCDELEDGSSPALPRFGAALVALPVELIVAYEGSDDTRTVHVDRSTLQGATSA